MYLGGRRRQIILNREPKGKYNPVIFHERGSIQSRPWKIGRILKNRGNAGRNKCASTSMEAGKDKGSANSEQTDLAASQGSGNLGPNYM